MPNARITNLTPRVVSPRIGPGILLSYHIVRPASVQHAVPFGSYSLTFYIKSDVAKAF
jgi:hypothetical protein